MAGSFKSEGEDDGIHEINIVPLVDIVLVLLIIFMVTAQFLRERPKPPPPVIPIEVPSAATGGAGPAESPLSLAIDQSGEWFLNGESAGEAEVRSFVESAGKPPRELEAVVAADRSIPHGDVIRLIDFLRMLGVERFAIVTKPQEIR